MGEDEVLAAGLADDARIAPVARDVGADRLPHSLKDRGAAGEVHAAQVRVVHRRVADLRAAPRYQIDDAVGQPRLLEHLHQPVGRENGGRRRLPDDGVAHHRGAGRQVAGDRGEVEGRDRQHEPLERPVLDVVPHPRTAAGLLAEDLGHVRDVVAEEVDQLARRVDLGLQDRLALVQHRRRIDDRAVLAGEQLGRLQEDGSARLPRHRRPFRTRRLGRGHRLPNGVGVPLVKRRQHVPVVVRHDALAEIAGRDLGAADEQRNLDLRAGDLGEMRGQDLPLRRPRRIAQNGLVDGRGHLHSSVVHRDDSFSLRQITASGDVSALPVTLSTRRSEPDS